MIEEQNLSPTGLRAEEPEPDFSAQYQAQRRAAIHERLPQLSLVAETRLQNLKIAEECLKRHHGNKAAACREIGISRKTLYLWLGETAAKKEDEVRSELAEPASKSTKTSLGRIKRQLELVIDDAIVGIPEKAKKATLMDSVNALVKLVPLLKDINSLLVPRQHVDGALKILKERAKKKLDKVKSDAETE